MSLSTTLEQTYFKLHCNTCGCITPHRDNSTTTQCEVCYTSNFSLSAKTEYYTGWELAAFWQARYRAVVGCGAPVRVTLTDHTLSYGAIDMQRDCYVSAANNSQSAGIVGTVMLAEPIQGGMLVSSETIPFVDPNSIGTL